MEVYIGPEVRHAVVEDALVECDWERVLDAEGGGIDPGLLLAICGLIPPEQRPGVVKGCWPLLTHTWPHRAGLVRILRGGVRSPSRTAVPP